MLSLTGDLAHHLGLAVPQSISLLALSTSYRLTRGDSPQSEKYHALHAAHPNSGDELGGGFRIGMLVGLSRFFVLRWIGWVRMWLFLVPGRVRSGR